MYSAAEARSAHRKVALFTGITGQDGAYLAELQSDEIDNLAVQSHVAVTVEEPEYPANADGIGALRLLEAIRMLGMEKKTRFHQASTSELYGLVQEIPQKESTPFYQRSRYAVTKLRAYSMTRQCSGSCCSTTSPRTA